MKPDPEKEAERWLRQAESDLASGRLLLREGFYAQACFTAQQVAEKALKGLAYLQGARFVVGHSVVELLNNLLETYPQLAARQETARVLDLYYIAPRYPNALPGLTPSEVFGESQAREAVTGANRLLEEARRILLLSKEGGSS